MKKNFKNIAVLTFFLFSVSAQALTSEEIKEAIHSRMSERHPEPIAGFWENLGPEALPVIKEMYKATSSPIEQSWLIDGLSHFSDPSVGELLKASISNSDNAVFKKKMVAALIESQGDSSYSFVEPYLKDKDPHIRLAVAKGMQKYMSYTTAQTRLTQYKKDETEVWVKADFDKGDPELDTRMKRGTSIFKPESTEAALKPLPEKEWAGEWKGVWVSPKKSGAATATLTFLDKSWKVELKLPKQTKYELKRDQLEVVYYQTAHAHWIEVRSKKDDSVFIAQKKYPKE